MSIIQNILFAIIAPIVLILVFLAAVCICLFFDIEELERKANQTYSS